MLQVCVKAFEFVDCKKLIISQLHELLLLLNQCRKQTRDLSLGVCQMMEYRCLYEGERLRVD
jgi:hypothetical protein